ncbi:MAG: zf-HC2 domain-containing protein [Myxococcota bacterium]|nr:zf-HC2 domain-containing protein [Myxococcota bacterium]
MKHSDVKNLMADYLEGDLELDKRALFDAHLDECVDCSDEVAGMRGTISILHSLPEPSVPEEMSRQVMRRIRSGEAYPTWWGGLKAVFAPLLEPRILAPVSAGVLVLGLFLGSADFRGRGVSPGVVADAGQVANSESRLVPAAAAPGFLLLQPDASVPQLAMVQPGSNQDMVALSNLMANSFPLGRVRLQPFPTPPLVTPPGYNLTQASSPYEMVAVNPGVAGLQNRVPIQSDSAAIERSRQPTAEEWLVRIRQDPSGFAGRLAAASLAEQELWVQNLARVASQNEQLGEVVASLRSSPSRGARLLADDFEAAGRATQSR